MAGHGHGKGGSGILDKMESGGRVDDTDAKRASRGRIPWHDKSNERAEQGRLEGRVENETEGREGRKKVNTGSMDKQRA